MALHDWTRVPDNVFHAFHLGWLWNLAGALDRGLLPSGYVARPEEYVGPYPSDVLTLRDHEAVTPSGSSNAAAPRPTLTLSPPRLETWRERRIVISSARGERRVAVIEVVSPGNRDSRRRARFFQAKLLECLSGGLHVLLIDLLPPSAAAPGFASELAQELGAGEGSLQPGGRAVTSFERREEPTSVLVYHHALALGEALPEPPLFLAPEHFVSVPLEATYAETVGGLPAVDRELLGAG